MTDSEWDEGEDEEREEGAEEPSGPAEEETEEEDVPAEVSEVEIEWVEDVEGDDDIPAWVHGMEKIEGASRSISSDDAEKIAKHIARMARKRNPKMDPAALDEFERELREKLIQNPGVDLFIKMDEDGRPLKIAPDERGEGRKTSKGRRGRREALVEIEDVRRSLVFEVFVEDDQVSAICEIMEEPDEVTCTEGEEPNTVVVQVAGIGTATLRLPGPPDLDRFTWKEKNRILEVQLGLKN